MEAEGAGITRLSEGGTVVEVAAAFGLPLPPLAAVAMTVRCAFDLGGGELGVSSALRRNVAQSSGVHPFCGLVPGQVTTP